MAVGAYPAGAVEAQGLFSGGTDNDPIRIYLQRLVHRFPLRHSVLALLVDVTR